MRKIVLYSIVLCAALIIPQRGTDIGKLQPVEVVLLDYIEGRTLIRTDTADEGKGESFTAALHNLKDTTAGTIFLDTADYLVVTESGLGQIEEIKPYLDASVFVCVGNGEIDLEAAAEYLAVHKPRIKLKNAEMSTNYQRLNAENGRLNLLK